MSETISLGSSVTDAFRLLRVVHRDVRSLCQTLDELLTEHGWEPSESTRIASQLSNGLGRTDAWAIKAVYRVYTPTSREASEHDRLIAFQVEFDPPRAYDEPQCLVAAVRLRRPVSPSQMWNGWYNEGSMKVLEQLEGQSDWTVLPGEQLPRHFFPEPVNAAVCAIPMCSLDGREAVRQTIVEPVLSQFDGTQLQAS